MDPTGKRLPVAEVELNERLKGNYLKALGLAWPKKISNSMTRESDVTSLWECWVAPGQRTSWTWQDHPIKGIAVVLPWQEVNLRSEDYLRKARQKHLWVKMPHTMTRPNTSWGIELEPEGPSGLQVNCDRQKHTLRLRGTTWPAMGSHNVDSFSKKCSQFLECQRWPRGPAHSDPSTPWKDSDLCTFWLYVYNLALS